MAASATGSEVSDGPVLNLMNKRLRALRKKHNRIIQMEEGLAQGKPLNKEQEEVLRSKPGVVALIDEYEKLRQPLSIAVQEEIQLAHQHLQVSSDAASVVQTEKGGDALEKTEKSRSDADVPVVEDLLNLLYFGSLFDVKPQSDFTSTMLTRTHERGCCLTYDYVTDDATDLLGERDLDLISQLGGLLISRPVRSGVSHKNALQTCIEHAKLWLSNSDQPIESGEAITYAGLRERLNKILASDYLTKTPEMKAPVEVVAAAGNYAEPVPSEPVQTEAAFVNYQQKEQETAGQEIGADQSIPAEEPAKDESELQNQVDVTSIQQDQYISQDVGEEQNQKDMEWKEQQYNPRRSYQNQRGGGRGNGGGGRRGYNGRGGRGPRGGGGYQNGRSQYYDQPGNYYPKNSYNTRGRGDRGGGGGHAYNNHGSAGDAGYAAASVES